MKPLISVIIPVYNVQEYIEDALISLFSQTYRNIEVILVDDCSQDCSFTLAKKICSVYQEFKVKFVVHNRNKGLSAARNTGMFYASGEYVFFMDSDDEITLDCIEKHYNAMISTNADFTVGNVELKGKKKHSVHIKHIPKEVTYQQPLKSYFSRLWSVSAWNKLYRKDFLIKNSLRFQSDLLFEDILWSYWVAKNASKLALVESATYKYLIRSNSITTQKNKAPKIDSLLFIIQTIYEDSKNDKNMILDKSELFHFLDFWRFNTALLLLNYAGSYKEARIYYNQLQVMMEYKSDGLYPGLLQIPFGLFYFLFKPIYFLYKKFI